MSFTLTSLTIFPSVTSLTVIVTASPATAVSLSTVTFASLTDATVISNFCSTTSLGFSSLHEDKLKPKAETIANDDNVKNIFLFNI